MEYIRKALVLFRSRQYDYEQKYQQAKILYGLDSPRTSRVGHYYSVMSECVEMLERCVVDAFDEGKLIENKNTQQILNG